MIASLRLRHVLLAFSSAICLSASSVEVDGIVAKVGDESILRSDVMLEMQRRGLPAGEARATIVNELVDRRLILKAARSSKMTMQEWVVENRIREIVKRSFDGDRNKLLEMLTRQKVTYQEWRAKTKEDMVVGAMRWNVVDKNVTASPSAMKLEYETNKVHYASDRQVSVAVILLKPEEASRRDEISKALAAKEKTFDELGGKAYKDIRPEEMFKPQVSAAIDALKTGEVSRWIEIDGWSFLLRKDKEVAGRQLTFAEAYDKIEAAVKEAEAKRLYEEWIARLREETYVKVF